MTQAQTGAGIPRMTKGEFQAFLKSRMAINGPPPGYEPPKARTSLKVSAPAAAAAPPSSGESTASPIPSTRKSAPPSDDNRESVPELAVTLAELFNDFAALGYYRAIARRVARGELLAGRQSRDVERMLLAKARELAARRAPHGPIANPAAVFAAWVKRL